ncbi:polypeptide N-acetylgalactosaminyltransferase 15-like [Gadus macrocephalus]|uniref:polypeptide N-acetylgalactosaminyltransferase 15-like n=1 Tax=Gadus macrocephalus TaxID=80720 RepID=UPI0028CB2BEB|nr:polypeptide N-acetylgalactosaminyltransferase 15-like [Gadus macrocephalus]
MRCWVRTRAIRRQILCLWFLLLGLALVTLGLLDLASPDPTLPKDKHPPRHPFGRAPETPDLEVIVDSRDPAPDRDVALSPLTSLQEEELLFVASSAQGSKTPRPLKRGPYKMIMRGKNTDRPTVPASTTNDSVEDTKTPQLDDLRGGDEGTKTTMMALRRTWPESRHPACVGEQYSESLPSTSVVICFQEEARATLLRTVHNVLDTVPKEYLSEILLVDDFQDEPLGSDLSEYIALLDGVRLVQSPGHLGTAQCRSLGASEAVGEVLVFMDAHCECQEDWLEPLLERVAQDRTRVVSPVVDLIDWHTFQYNATRWPVRGVFDWRLDFHWESYPQPQALDKDSVVQPVSSPVLGGEVLAVDRHFFLSVGGYDPDMLLRGSEQIELSIRVWSCGGSLEVVPCSRVARLDHPPPHTPPDHELLQKNKIRLADSWMDAYGKIFYRRDPLAHFISQSESPNITERVRLKESLGCRDFHWFLSTVYPQLYIPQDRPGLSGELYNVGTGSCADLPGERTLQNGTMSIAPCSGTGKQLCELNSQGEVRWGAAGELCFDGRGERITLAPCPSHQPTQGQLQWRFLKLSGQLVHMQSQLCVEATRDDGSSQGGSGLFLRPCIRHPRQQWHFEQLVAP